MKLKNLATLILLPISLAAQTNQELMDELRAMRREMESLHSEVRSLRQQLAASGIASPSDTPLPVAGGAPGQPGQRDVPAGDPGIPAGPEGSGGNIPFVTVSAAGGVLGFNHTAEAFKGQVNYFQPFGRFDPRYAIQLGNDYSFNEGQPEDQVNIATAVRFGSGLQAGALLSVKHIDLKDFAGGTAAGQSGLSLNWILPEKWKRDGKQSSRGGEPSSFGGAVGLFALHGLYDNRRISKLDGETYYMRSLSQFGASAQFGWVNPSDAPEPRLELTYAYLRQPSLAAGSYDLFGHFPDARIRSRNSGSARLVVPITRTVAFTLEAAFNPTLIRAGSLQTEILFGVEFGVWPAYRGLRGAHRAAPILIPPIRYEVLGTAPSGPSDVLPGSPVAGAPHE